MPEILVIGIDGATWQLIDPWMSEHRLPTLKELAENGVRGRLKSTVPPLTGPAWVSFATGKNPGKHGCYDFMLPQRSLDRLKPITSRDINGKTFYEILEENEKRCIIINLPVSYPPRGKGMFITSLMTPGEDFVFPPELVEDIPELKEYRISPDRRLYVRGQTTEYINDIRNLERHRFECAKKLFRKNWDFFFILFSASDWIQHLMYGHLLSKRVKENSPAARAFEEIDTYISWFINNKPQDTDVLIMSDHGFGVYKGTFLINEWLRKEGYVKVQSNTTLPVSPHRLGAEEEEVRAERLHIKYPLWLLKLVKLPEGLLSLYKAIRKVLPLELNASIKPKLSESVAFSTTSISTNCAGIYINDKERFRNGVVETQKYNEIRNEITRKLMKLADPWTGKRVIKSVLWKEDVYSGEMVGNAPDIVVVSEEYSIDGLRYSSRILSNRETFDHDLNGIFIAYGPNFKRHTKVHGAEIYDIAPTVLHMLRVPIPIDLDGRVLREIFESSSEPATRKTIFKKDLREILKTKIRKLKSQSRL